MIMLEGAKATTETVDALRTGAAAMKAMQKATYVSFFILFILSYLHIQDVALILCLTSHFQIYSFKFL